MPRATTWTTLLGLVLSPSLLWAQSGNAGTRQAPGSGGANAGTRQAPGGSTTGTTRQTSGSGNAGTRQAPNSGNGNAGTRIIPHNWDPNNAGTRIIPPDNSLGGGGLGGGGLEWGGAPGDLTIGQVVNGSYLPAAGNGTLFVGTRQPFVLAAPSTFGGPVYIQQPRFFENSVTGGVGGVVVGGSQFSRNGLGQRVEGGNFGAVGPGVSGFNSAYASGINIGINGNARLGGNGGFIGFQAGPQAAGGPGFGAANVAGRVNTGGGVNIGFNATGFQGAAVNRAFLQPVVPVVIGGGPGATMSNALPAGGVAPAFGNAVPSPRNDRSLTPNERARLDSPPSMVPWLQEMWNSPASTGYLANKDKRGAEQLFASTLQLLDTAVARGKPLKLPDGATLHLVRPTSMVYTTPDGKSSTGWLQGQEMPDVFGLVAVQLYGAVDANRK